MFLQNYNMTNNTCGAESSQDCAPSHNRADQLTGRNQAWQWAFRSTGALYLSKRAITAYENTSMDGFTKRLVVESQDGKSCIKTTFSIFSTQLVK